jgi:hypothetical protein
MLFEVLTAVVMKASKFLDITPCSPLKVYRRFGGKYRLHIHGRRINQATRQHEACSKQSFDPEDGGHMFLRNVD